MTRTTKTTQETARKQFVDRFGDRALSVVQRFEEGLNNRAVSRELKLPLSVVAAYRANWSRGVYEDFTVQCGFTSRWSDTAFSVVEMIRAGSETDYIADVLGLSTTTVATYRANHTRGHYTDMF